MSAHNFDSILASVAIKTIEKLAFIFPVVDGNCVIVPDHYMSSRVLFSGPFSGSLILKITSALALELTANMLGIEEDKISPEQQYDAIREALNVICGNLLPEIAGDQQIFNIHSPEILSEDNSRNTLNNSGRKHSGRAILLIDNERIDLCLHIDSQDGND